MVAEMDGSSVDESVAWRDNARAVKKDNARVVQKEVLAVSLLVAVKVVWKAALWVALLGVEWDVQKGAMWAETKVEKKVARTVDELDDL
jgi:hypothetical protein